MQIGLFGGSFDPPHAGHRALAQAGLETAGLDQVWVMPANPVHRQLTACISGQTRLAWTEQLFAQTPNIHVLDWEIRNDHPTPTVETLRQIAREFPHHRIWLM
ncbi:MAG: nicotinate-nicotinamide nucleotide adenylyltransferase, partial [Mariprofundus sp.]